MLLAIQFLTVIPVRVSGEITLRDLHGVAAYFPVAGAIQGIAVAGAAFVSIKVVPADIAAAAALLVLIITNGGFDLDGLADTADGLSVKSSGDTEQDREKRLRVMKDSASGAMGVIALIMAILLQFVLMNRVLSDFPFPLAGLLFFLMPAFSKWVTVPELHHGVPARKDGLGKIFIEGTDGTAVVVSTVIMAALALSAAIGAGVELRSAALFSGFCIIALYGFGYTVTKFLSRRFGGITGDHCGALTEITHVMFLLVGYLWFRRM